MRKSVAALEAPRGSRIDEVEWECFVECVRRLEEEVESVREGRSSEVVRCRELLGSVRDRRIKESEERKRIRLEVVSREVTKEVERIERETEEGKEQLFERIVRSMQQCYQETCEDLKGILGKDYMSFINERGIDFPIVESSGKSKYQHNDDAKIKLNGIEGEQDLKSVQEYIKSL